MGWVIILISFIFGFVALTVAVLILLAFSQMIKDDILADERDELEEVLFPNSLSRKKEEN